MDFDLKEIVDEIISQPPQLFFEKVIPFIHSQTMRFRLVDTLTDRQIQQLIDPDNKIELKLFWKELKLQFQEGFFSPHNFPEIRLMVFENILDVINFNERITQRHKKLKLSMRCLKPVPLKKQRLSLKPCRMLR